jgi:hypothetical protein
MRLAGIIILSALHKHGKILRIFIEDSPYALATQIEKRKLQLGQWEAGSALRTRPEVAV